MKSAVVTLAISSLIIFLSGFMVNHQDNAMPRISLLLKSGQRTFSPGATIQYSIVVDDKEDGSSKYKEIATNEVFLETIFLPDSGMTKKAQDMHRKDAPVFQLMKKGTCFNCHSLKKTMVGPSFAEILMKYQKKPALTEYLAQKIINGSKGVWGDSQLMPSHPEFSPAQAMAIAAWMQKKANDPFYDLQTGLEGRFSAVAAKEAGPRSVYLLFSTYLDHGIQGSQNREAEQVITLTNK